MSHSRILFGALLGNTLEYFEFTIFAIFAIQIGKSFFPDYAPETQILFTFLIFGSGFIARPLGSIVFGHIGDKIGRKVSLVLTVTGMSIVTIGIGLMPSYNKIGILAPIVLTLFRLMQGLFLGGEGVGAAIYVLEHELERTFKFTRGVIGGFLITANMAGTLLAATVGIIIDTTIGLNHSTWRWAFVVGGLCGLLVSVMRLSLPETGHFTNVSKKAKPKVPLFHIFNNHLKEAGIVVAFGGFTASISHINKGYFATYFQSIMKLPEEVSFYYVSYLSALIALLPPILGYFSDKYTYKRFNKVTIALIILLYLPAFMLIATQSVPYIILGLTIIGVLSAAILTPTYVFLSDLFPAEVRYSGVGVSFNIGVTIFGGFAPVISDRLIRFTGLYYAPAFYVLSLALIYVVLLTWYTRFCAKHS